MKKPLSFLLLLCGLCSFATPTAAQVGTCTEPEARALLDVGNVSARIFNNGAYFWRERENLYEVPKGSGINAVFTSTFVVGGIMGRFLKMASSSYGPYEFWPGPLDENGNPPSDCSIYDKIWEIHADDFAQYDMEGAFSTNMRNWPWQLGAPVIDGDGNPSNYNLEGGDRPELLGNQTLWWIMNDRGNEHLWSEVGAIGLEVKVSAFAFKDVRSIGDITFYRYILTNKNTEPLTDAFAGMWADPDLGNATDNYLGSDSLLHLIYAYNADPVDENGYEDNPPAVGYTFLLTPEAQLDEIDNDHDGQVDEPGERAGMYAAMSFDSGGGIQGDPGNGVEMYSYLRARWPNGQRMTFGGTGLDYSNRVTRYVYSGDPLTQSYWSEFKPTLTNDAPNPPSSRRFITSSGPFTMLPGETKEFLIALVWAQGSDHLDSVRKLKDIVASMQASPESYLATGYRPELNEPIPPDPEEVLGFDQNFPNPFSDYTTLRYSLPKTMQVRLAVYDLLGREIAVLTQGSQEAGVHSLRFEGAQLPPGIYYARIELDHLQFTKKLVRIP